MGKERWMGVGLLGLVITLSCSSNDGDPKGSCIPGAQVSCPCTDGRMGAQSCQPDGTFGACSCTSNDAGVPDAADAGCIPETDPALCARLGKTCEPVTAQDNCGVSRSVSNCGTCSVSASACVANVCKAPVCGTDYGGYGTIVTSLSAGVSEDALLGVSATGASVLYLHAVTGCLTPTSELTIADATTVNLPTPPTYTGKLLSGLASLAGFSLLQQSMTLSADGLTIVGVGVGNKTFLESKRSAIGQTDFSMTAVGPFATLNAAIPSGAQVAYPVETTDGLAFYYQVGGASNPVLDGIYEAVRTQTSAQFDAGVKMPATVQAFGAITGISSDRMTLFVSASFATSILTRSSLSQPFATSATTPPTQAFRVMPVSTCSVLFGTCEPGGCMGETICIWSKH